MDRDKRGTFLARRKKHSTLTAGIYRPESGALSAEYWGVFVDDTPYILLLSDEERSAREKAEQIATSSNFRTLLEATLTACEQIKAGRVDGASVDWSEDHTVISASRSGNVETGTTEMGEIRAIILSGSHRAVAETFCIDGALAKLLDADFPQVSDFEALPELSEDDVKMSLGQLEASKHPRECH
ncbi:MAG: hypothetical protein R3193_04850 [Marinobacter sp.]|nr:hypothetical protein [Marinobacter sp.]